MIAPDSARMRARAAQRASGRELPRLYVIADPGFAGGMGRFDRLIQSLGQAARLQDSQLAIQVRAKGFPGALLAEVARLSRETIGTEALLVLNGPERLANELGYDGVHWPEAAIPGTAAVSRSSVSMAHDHPAGEADALAPGGPERPGPTFRSAAAHSGEVVRHAHRAGATAVVYGPVFAPSWKKANPVGLKALTETAKASPLPVYALGGIGPEQVVDCLAAGAHGIAVLSGIAGAADPVAAIDRYLAAVRLAQFPESPP